MDQCIVFESNGLKLSGTICLSTVKDTKGGVLFLPGAGTLTKDVYLEWQKHLAQHGYHSFVFDFPGIGAREGELKNSSLASRLANSEVALGMFLDKSGLSIDQITVCGRSMGGPLALTLADTHQLPKLILLYPAAYAAEAFDKPFTAEFTKVIRAEDSWHDSPDFDRAENYKGEIMIIYGSLDRVIPGGIQARYLEIARSKGVALVLDGFGHNEYLWENTDVATQKRAEVFVSVLDFLES